MHPKTLAPCGADETNQRDLISAGNVSTLSPAPRGSSDAITEASDMTRTYINCIEQDEQEIEMFLAICQRDLSQFPRRTITPTHVRT
jgi:hypothetical protein